MKKRWIVVIVVVILIIAGIGSNGRKNKDGVKNVVDSTEAKQKDDEGDKVSKSDDKTESSKTNKVTIDEQVLIDQDGIKITATEYNQNGLFGDAIKVVVENETSNDVMVGCTALVVNDFMINDLFASKVAARKKANETIDLYTSELNAAGIETVGQVEIYFHIYDADTFEKILDSDCVTIKTSEYANMDTSADDSGKELYNEGGIRIVGKTVDENSFWGTAILLYTENKSGRNVGISVDNMSINDFMMSPFFSTVVYDGKKSFDDITVFKKDLEENNIQSIDTVELSFRIYDADSYETITESDPITFSAK
jgi:hypothetical protein